MHYHTCKSLPNTLGRAVEQLAGCLANQAKVSNRGQSTDDDVKRVSRARGAAVTQAKGYAYSSTLTLTLTLTMSGAWGRG